jgi:hypothetical protein
MKTILSLFLLAAVAVAPLIRAEEEKKADDPKAALRTKLSTAIGIMIAENLKQVKDDADIDLILKTAKEVSEGAKPSMTQQEISAGLHADGSGQES